MAVSSAAHDALWGQAVAWSAAHPVLLAMVSVLALVFVQYAWNRLCYMHIPGERL